MMGRMTCARAFEYVVHPLGSSLSSHSLCSCAPTAVHNILITGGDRLDTNRAIFAERASGRQNVIGALLPGILLLLGILWWKHSSGAVRGRLPGYTASGIVLYWKRCASGVQVPSPGQILSSPPSPSNYLVRP